MASKDAQVSASPFVRHIDRLVELIQLTRCSVRFTISDAACSLADPNYGEISLSEMLMTATNSDISILSELLRWHKLHPNDPLTQQVYKRLLRAQHEDGNAINTIEELFNHYLVQGYEIGQTCKSSALEGRGKGPEDLLFVRFPAPYEERNGAFGHEVHIEGKKQEECFYITPKGILEYGVPEYSSHVDWMREENNCTSSDQN